MNWVLQFRQVSCTAGASDMGQPIGGNGSEILAELCTATTMDSVAVTTPHQDKPELSAAKSFYVREIFAATGGEFVANEIVNRNDRQPQPVASACTPTTRNSTPFERSNSINSLKSLFSKRQSLHYWPTQFLNGRQSLRNRTRQPVRHVTNVVVRLVQRGFSDDFCDGHAALSKWQAAVATGSRVVMDVAAMQRSGIEVFVDRR